MIEKLFENNPIAWFIGLSILGVILLLSLKFKFWYFIFKIDIVLLIMISLYYLVIPWINSIIFDAQFIVDFFSEITLNVWDDYQLEITFTELCLLFFITWLLFKIALSGSKTGDKPEYMKEKRTD